MNILFYIHDTIDPLHGGIHRVTDVLVRRFSKDHQVFCLMANKTRIDKLNNHYYLPNSTDIMARENVSFTRKLISDLSIDIIINQDGITPSSSSFILSVERGNAKMITVIHSTPTLMYGIGKLPNSFQKNLPKEIQNFLGKAISYYFRMKYGNYWNSVVEKSDRIVMLSKSLETNLSEFMCKDFPSNKIISIPNPVTLEAEGTPHKERMVLYVGRLSREKNIKSLLKIWERVHASNPLWRLEIIGDGDERAKLEKYAESNNIRNVKFRGQQNPQYWYERASVFCLTSTFEGLPLVLLEAMTFGDVPIAFDSFLAAKDVIDDGRNGFLVNAYDESHFANILQEILDNEQMRNVMSNNARKKASEFSLEKIVNNWYSLFSEYV